MDARLGEPSKLGDQDYVIHLIPVLLTSYDDNRDAHTAEVRRLNKTQPLYSATGF